MNKHQKSGSIIAEHRQSLDANRYNQKPINSTWERGFSALIAFKQREGHCDVLGHHIENTFKLGRWVRENRKCRYTMPAELRQELDKIGFIWNSHSNAWERGFAELKKFKAREGHCRVPRHHVEGTFKLGKWINAQRCAKNSMPAERRERLDAIGFVWDARKNAWDEFFAALIRFKAREGHCRVPKYFVDGPLKLRQWASSQRATKDTMPPERRQRLDEIGFVWRVRKRHKKSS